MSSTLLELRVSPNASQTQVVGLHGQAVKIKLRAPPVDGKANEALIEFLAKALKIPKSRIALERGLSSRSKFVRIDGLEAREVRARLGLEP